MANNQKQQFEYERSLTNEILKLRAENERLQRREVQFGVALLAVMDEVEKDSPQWLLADGLWRMLNQNTSAQTVTVNAK